MSGLRFARLVDEARFQAASRLLREPAIRIIDVSVALDYTDAANFTRTFRHWVGVSPLAFRRAASQLDAGAS
jgi:AraC-like DNA-binding protein